MQDYQKRVLYAKISKTREACAGSDVQNQVRLLSYIVDAIEYAGDVSAPDNIIGTLTRAKVLILNIAEYKDRLAPDRLLCDLLNGMLRD